MVSSELVKYFRMLFVDISYKIVHTCIIVLYLFVNINLKMFAMELIDVYIEKGMFDKRFKNVNLMLQRSDKLKV